MLTLGHQSFLLPETISCSPPNSHWRLLLTILCCLLYGPPKLLAACARWLIRFLLPMLSLLEPILLHLAALGTGHYMKQILQAWGANFGQQCRIECWWQKQGVGKNICFCLQVCYFKSSGKLFQFSWFTLSSSSIDVLTSPQICNNNNWSMIKLSWWLIYKDIIIHHIFPHKCQSLKSNYQSSYWSSLCLLSTKLFLTHLPQFKLLHMALIADPVFNVGITNIYHSHPVMKCSVQVISVVRLPLGEIFLVVLLKLSGVPSR